MTTSRLDDRRVGLRARILQLMFLAVVALLSATAQDYCSLVVHVEDPGGNPLSGVRVIGEESTGHAFYDTTNGGEARFCDLGISSVTVTVGFSGCQSIVRDMPLVWRLTREIKIVYDRTPCISDPPPPILLCSILFRFTDGNGNWIAGVGFKPPSARSPNLLSDRYGRVMVLMANREELHTGTEKSGYLPEAIDLRCSNNLMDVERTVTLRKSP